MIYTSHILTDGERLEFHVSRKMKCGIQNTLINESVGLVSA